mgnify:CR=1 FL=1
MNTPDMPPTHHRYAVYFAPNPGSLGWLAGSHWLGRCAALLQPLQQLAIDGVAARIDAKKKEVNSKLGSWEQVKYIKVLPRELTEQDGELTPSMKVKRKVVIERYRDTIESMYQGKEKGDKD